MPESHQGSVSLLYGPQGINIKTVEIQRHQNSSTTTTTKYNYNNMNQKRIMLNR